jgi:hypothetical protein
MADESRRDDDVLYQDVRWMRMGRFQYGMIAFPLWILGLVGSIGTGKLNHVVLALALFTPPIAVCEWRMRKLGLIIRRDEIVLVRPLNHTRIPWHEIESFRLVVPPGFIDYGNRRIGVKRRRHVVPRATMVIPTVWLSVRGEKRWPPPNGPSRLRSRNGEVTDVMGFLEQQLADHQDQRAETLLRQ